MQVLNIYNIVLA